MLNDIVAMGAYLCIDLCVCGQMSPVSVCLSNSACLVHGTRGYLFAHAWGMVFPAFLKPLEVSSTQFVCRFQACLTYFHPWIITGTTVMTPNVFWFFWRWTTRFPPPPGSIARFARPSLRALPALSRPSLSALSSTSPATSSALLGTPPASERQHSGALENENLEKWCEKMFKLEMANRGVP